MLIDAKLRAQGKIAPSRLYAYFRGAWQCMSIPPGDAVGYWRGVLQRRGFATAVVKIT